eukprot:CAMPEP_0197899988 /NCGR_PEP_ID=MMETSP1439-20131203/47910_1 /TAXON_ID=66791 /ORGANISM="Gonyaulax spinifera, Strain CCMP409" /LENGTH=85 /DNA_ID=CAMNT_0043520837 /DNA_START=14 /DNA_END=268 /DNA_ORIENTATION=-
MISSDRQIAACYTGRGTPPPRHARPHPAGCGVPGKTRLARLADARPHECHGHRGLQPAIRRSRVQRLLAMRTWPGLAAWNDQRTS